jgi:hypothetical protein
MLRGMEFRRLSDRMLCLRRDGEEEDEEHAKKAAG